MQQQAPTPQPLVDLVNSLTYKPGWYFKLADIDRGQGSEGETLTITVCMPDTHSGDAIAVRHLMIVPAASYNRRSWQRWLFDQILLVEQHEAMEFFKIDGEQPYHPLHGPGNDPYLIAELATDEERRTDFRGVLHPKEAQM